MVDDPDHKPIPPDFRETLNALAEVLDDYFNPSLPGLPRQRKVGFFLTCFNFDDQGRFNYISNADKLDVKRMMLDIAARIEAREKMDAAGPTKGRA